MTQGTSPAWIEWGFKLLYEEPTGWSLYVDRGFFPDGSARIEVSNELHPDLIAAYTEGDFRSIFKWLAAQGKAPMRRRQKMKPWFQRFVDRMRRR